MARWLYNLLFPFVFVVMLPGYLRRMVRRGNFRRSFGQRFGFYSVDLRQRLASGPPRIWLQAVSVGEMLTALKLVAALRERHPGLPLIVSTTTTTGYQLARERVGSEVEVIYTPIDLPWAVRRAFATLRPCQMVIVDGGLWPNLLWEARRRGVPTALVNARLSPRSERRFRRLRFLAGAMFRLLDLVCVSESDDVRRWQEIGVSPQCLQHTGSIKFDASSKESSSAGATENLRAWVRTRGVADDDPVLLAGSTHPGEEGMLARMFLRLKKQFPKLRLFVAPRHVERTPEIRTQLEAMGLAVVLRTERIVTTANGGLPRSDFDVLLLNTTGELRDWYSLATVVFIGKSLAAVGGQNPAEAIAAGRPVIFGPHMENFRDLVAQLLRSEGALQRPDSAELETACRGLLADPAARARMADRARRQLHGHRGAALRTADLLLTPAKFSPCQLG